MSASRRRSWVSGRPELAKHYNLAGQHEAARQWQQLALKLRDGARQRTKRRKDAGGHLR